jgi:hypothetical protein
MEMLVNQSQGTKGRSAILRGAMLAVLGIELVAGVWLTANGGCTDLQAVFGAKMPPRAIQHQRQKDPTPHWAL